MRPQNTSKQFFASDSPGSVSDLGKFLASKVCFP